MATETKKHATWKGLKTVDTFEYTERGGTVYYQRIPDGKPGSLPAKDFYRIFQPIEQAKPEPHLGAPAVQGGLF